MKVPASTIAHEGNLDLTTRTRLSFDENSLVHLMSVLTDLYSDPVLAVIREYSCNALDSHVAAGNPDPIRVYLPNSLDHTFRVVDQGVGLSHREITELFSKYGWSSKRDTDNEVGMLGLGCKSGLTYTSQFTVIAVQDGVRTTVLVTRDTDGVGALQVLDVSSVDLPNGVEVRIPVKDTWLFNDKARKFFRFWAEGAVLVDDESPARIGSDAKQDMWLTDNVVITQSTDRDYVVMGNVPYPVDNNNRIINGYNHHAVVWVPMGAIDFTPSREALHLTTRTKQVLQDTRELIDTTAKEIAQKEVDNAATHYEAFKASRKWRKFLVKTPLSYKGELVPNSDYIPGQVLGWYCPDYEMTKYEQSQSRNGFTLDKMEEAWLITGHNATRLTATEKTRLVVYRQQEGIKPARVLLSPEPLGAPWTDGAAGHVTDWSEVRKVKLAPADREKPRTKWILGNETSPVLAYIVAKLVNRSFPLYEIKMTMSDVGVAVVPTASVKRWLKHFPTAVPLADLIQERAQAFADKLSPVEAYGVLHAWTPALNLTGHVEDPALAEFVKLTRNHVLNLRSTHGYFLVISQRLGLAPPKLPDTKEITEALNKYPLLHNNENGKHLTEYVNALFTYNRNEKD